MPSTKLTAGQAFPDIVVARLKNGKMKLSEIASGFDWRLVVVYRGKHCPLCTKYLVELNEMLPQFRKIGIDVVAVSADSYERAQAQMQDVHPNFEVGYDLSIQQMEELGLYISHPRAPTESDRPFSEPALFVINNEGNLQMVDISNAPFADQNCNLW